MEKVTEEFLRNEVKLVIMKETIKDLQERNMQLRAKLEATEKENEELKARLNLLTDK